MSTTIENDAENLSPGARLTHEHITALSNNMFEKMLIMENGNFRKLDPAKDTRSVYFDKAKIDALFAAHPGSDGLKIYFGVHHSAVFKPREPGYENKLMVMLVTTTAEVENLDKSVDPKMAKVTLGAAAPVRPGSGMDDGKLCPPDSGCIHD